MKQTKIIMGMTITVEIIDLVDEGAFNKVFDYFTAIDERFSTYKTTSEISQYNAGLIKHKSLSDDMKLVLQLCEQTKQETDGYFDIEQNGKIDPSGLVKGWAIQKAAELLQKNSVRNFYIDAGGDIQVGGRNKKREKWTVGIKNPFDQEQIVKRLVIDNEGVATSGTYERGEHVWTKITNDTLQMIHDEEEKKIISLTVVGPNIYDADRFATAAYAMGKQGINFIESLKGFEGYIIGRSGIATMTSGFAQYVL